MPRIARIVGITLAAAAFALAPNATASESRPSFQEACEAFRPVSAAQNEAVVSSAFQPATKGRAAFCLVRASITTSPTSRIDYRIDLPDTALWNQKLMTIGGGGFDGYIPLDMMGYELWRSSVGYHASPLDAYVLVSTDSGHQGRGAYAAFDMSWANQNPDAMENHVHRANHLVLWSTVQIVRQFYGREPHWRYMLGGSNGGRQGLMAAQKYPGDYHGIIAMMPAISQTAIFANNIPLLQHIFKRPENWLGPDALALFTKAEVEACDGLDGLRDGVTGNYEACSFVGAPLACAADQSDQKTCLTPGQIETIKLVRADKRVDVPLADGMTGYPGFGVGAIPSAWSTFLMGSSFETRDSGLYLMANQQIKIVTRDPNADIMTFDPLKWQDAIGKFSSVMDTTNPDLSPFFAGGGKIIIWHGVGDTVVSYRRTSEYVDRVKDKVGVGKMRKSLRFFVSPTIDHHFQGPEANTLPLLASLEDWVEHGRAPHKVVATRLDPPPSFPDLSTDGKVEFQRPLCEYGTFPRYAGKGDQSRASSFTCATR